jgi:hypothetical protein
MTIKSLREAGVGALFGLALFTASAASASPIGSEFGPNLVTNGGFEATASMAGSGWTASGFVSEGFDYLIDLNPLNAQSGFHSFAGGAVGAPGFISQVIATTAGQHYNIHLWLANLSGFTDGTAIQVLWNGSVVYSATDIPGLAYHEIVIDPMATSGSTTLSIGLQDDGFFLNVDDIAVYATTAAPEPATLALLGLGLAGVAVTRRRRLHS